MTKILNNKYYTSPELAEYCINKVFSLFDVNAFNTIIEPSAGAGVFLDLFPKDKNILAYDILPERDDIIKKDFFEVDIEYSDKNIVIGNPPFGNIEFKKFCDKAFEIAPIVAFILPVSQYKNNQYIYKYDLVYSEDLGKQKYSGIDVYCCFNIYQKPKNKRYNNEPNIIDKSLIDYIEYRSTKELEPQIKAIKEFNYDYHFCILGNGALLVKFQNI